MPGFRYIPPAYPWVTVAGLFNPGESVPRTNLENQALCPKPWPTIYKIPAMGLGAMPLFQLGATLPVQMNRYANFSVGRNVLLPGLAKLPYGDGSGS